MAREWVERNTDPNEVAKALTYLRGHPDGPAFFRYLRTVQKDGRAVVRSGRTLEYYRAIRDACRRHLTPYQDNPKAMAEILGWAVRLMRYYAVADRLGPMATPPRAAQRRPAARPAAAGDHRTGTVKWFNTDKRYGFITPDGGGQDVFVHLSQVAGGQALRERQRVSFIMGIGPKGRPQARDVQPEIGEAYEQTD